MKTRETGYAEWRIRQNQQRREWAAKNRVKSRAIKKKWRDANKGKSYALTRAWQEKNRDRLNRLARERYAENLESSHAKLRAKRIKMGAKYRAQVKRSRTRIRGTAEGMLCHRMSQCIRHALRGTKRRCKWEALVGYSVAELREHFERRFLPGMTWERFFGGEIHIDHIVPRIEFQFDSSEDERFRQCWALSNLRPLWSVENTRRGALHRWYFRNASAGVGPFTGYTPPNSAKSDQELQQQGR